MCLLCAAVYRARASECFGQEPVRVTETSGYLASTITEETECGSTTSPWRLEVKAGQKISFTLYDFGLANSSSSSSAISGDQSSPSSGATQCQVGTCYTCHMSPVTYHHHCVFLITTKL